MTGNARGLHPGRGVGGVAGGDLRFDQGPQQFLRCPPLGLRGDQQLGGEPADGGELEPACRETARIAATALHGCPA